MVIGFAYKIVNFLHIKVVVDYLVAVQSKYFSSSNAIAKTNQGLEEFKLFAIEPPKMNIMKLTIEDKTHYLSSAKP